MSSVEYWEESLGQALCDVGVWELITKEQRREIAEALASSAENESMCMGWDCIPNPQDTEIDRLKAAHAEERRQWEQRDSIYRRDIARSQRVAEQDVFIKDGFVAISTR
jgi:hypothetical protein